MRSDTKVLVTGCAGFIGFHMTEWLLHHRYAVVGIDNLNHYYDVSLKLDRLRELGVDPNLVAAKRLVRSPRHAGLAFMEMDVTDALTLQMLFAEHKFTHVIHLAAQAGVRYSLENPQAYISSNIVGFATLLESCRNFPPDHLVYASSSSVYGRKNDVPYSVGDDTSRPVSLYAASKKSNELMAYTYSELYGIPTTGLRFFTVYGEWGRPDMATFLFAKAIFAQQPIQVFNNGQLSRDFTYVGDIVEGVGRVFSTPPTADVPAEYPPYRLYNIGNGQPVPLLDFIRTMEKITGIEAIKEWQPMQAGDVYETWADISRLRADFDYAPKTDLAEGLTKFIDWYAKYYQLLPLKNH